MRTRSAPGEETKGRTTPQNAAVATSPASAWAARVTPEGGAFSPLCSPRVARGRGAVYLDRIISNRNQKVASADHDSAPVERLAGERTTPETVLTPPCVVC